MGISTWMGVVSIVSVLGLGGCAVGEVSSDTALGFEAEGKATATCYADYGCTWRCGIASGTMAFGESVSCKVGMLAVQECTQGMRCND